VAQRYDVMPELEELGDTWDEVADESYSGKCLSVDGDENWTGKSTEVPIRTELVTDCVAMAFRDDRNSVAYAAHFPVEGMEYEELRRELTDFAIDVYMGSDMEDLEAAVVGSNADLGPFSSDLYEDSSRKEFVDLFRRGGQAESVRGFAANMVGGEHDLVFDRVREGKEEQMLAVVPDEGFFYSETGGKRPRHEYDYY